MGRPPPSMHDVQFTKSSTFHWTLYGQHTCHNLVKCLTINQSINHTVTQRADSTIFLKLFRARNIRTVTVSVVLTTRRNCVFRAIIGIVVDCVIDCDVEFYTHSFRSCR
jgi:hypothetical protein